MTSSGKGKNVSLADWFSQMHTKAGHVLHVLYAMSRRHEYTHPVSWKNPNILPFVNKVCGEEAIHPDSCICWNCCDNIGLGVKHPAMFQPRREKKREDIGCYMHGCNEKAYKQAKLATRGSV